MDDDLPTLLRVCAVQVTILGVANDGKAPGVDASSDPAFSAPLASIGAVDGPQAAVLAYWPRLVTLDLSKAAGLACHDEAILSVSRETQWSRRL